MMPKGIVNASALLLTSCKKRRVSPFQGYAVLINDKKPLKAGVLIIFLFHFMI
jgi:hypothetical protein